jgi:hypothetical protein
VRLWDGSGLPPGARQRIEREFERWQFTHAQLLAIAKERRVSDVNYFFLWPTIISSSS